MVFSRREGTEGKRDLRTNCCRGKSDGPGILASRSSERAFDGGEEKAHLSRTDETFIDDLNRLPIEVDAQATSATVFDVTQSLCRKHRLTAYDAAYLEIAMREGRTLATVDQALRDAALAENVIIL